MEERVPELGDRLRTVGHHKVVIFSTVLAFVAGALAYAVAQPDRYAAASRVVVQPVVLPSSTWAAAIGAVDDQGEVDIETEAEIAGSPLIASRVIRALEGSPGATQLPASPNTLADMVETEAVTDDLIEITASARTPDLAVLVADSFAEQYLDRRTEAAARVIDAAVDALRVRVSRLERSIDRLDERMIELARPSVAAPIGEEPAARPGSATPLPAAERKAELDRVRVERDQWIVELGALRARQGDLLAASAGSVGGGQVVQRAVATDTPVFPQPIRFAAIAVLLGSILGLALAFLLERIRDRIRTRDDAAQSAHAPVLATLPRRMRRRVRRRKPRLAVTAKPFGIEAQAYRTLRANLIALRLGTDVRSLVVAFADDGAADEVVANLATVMAGAGLRVLAVCAFARGSRLPALLANGFDVSANPVGLSSVLTGEAPLSAATTRTGTTHLLLVGPGAPRSWSPDLLASDRFAQVMSAAEQSADVVLIEASAVGAGSDATTLAIHAGGALLVVRAGRDRRDSVARASAALQQVGCPPIGVLLVSSRGRDGTVGVPSPERGWAPSPAANGAGNGTRPARRRGGLADAGVAGKGSELPPMGGDT